MAWKGKFKPKHPEKYVGDANNIIFRSRIELCYLQYFDEHPDVIAYASEEIAIPYVSPLDLRQHRYFPDVVIRRRDPDGKIRTLMIEFKHSSDLTEPKPPTTGKGRRRYLAEAAGWAKNQAKWAAARAFCEERGWVFMVMSEKELGAKYYPGKK